MGLIGTLRAEPLSGLSGVKQTDYGQSKPFTTDYYSVKPISKPRTSPYSVFTNNNNRFTSLPAKEGSYTLGQKGLNQFASVMKPNAPGGNQSYAKPAFKTSQNKPNVPPNQLGQNLLNYASSPQGRGMARGLLEASGYSTTPVSFGQGIAQGLKYSDEAKDRELDDEIKKLQLEQLKKDLKNPKRDIVELGDGFKYFINPDGTTERVDPSIVNTVDESKADIESRKEDFKNANDLRDEHTKNSGEYIKVRDAYGRVLSSGVNPSAAGDLALIFNYMKMLDPGSTVREGEFANAQNSGSLSDIIVAQYNSVKAGTRLSQVQRIDFLDRSKSLYENAKTSQKYLDESYKDLSDTFGVDSKKVVIDFSKPLVNKIFEYDINLLSSEELSQLPIDNYSEKQKQIIEKVLKSKINDWYWWKNKRTTK